MKNKKLIGSATIVFFLVCGLIGCFFYINGTSMKVQRQLDLGNRYLEEQDYEQAKVAYEQAIEIDQMDVEAYLGLADAYVGLENYEKAIEVLKLGYGINPDERIYKRIAEIEALRGDGIQEYSVSEEKEQELQIEELPNNMIEYDFELTDFKIMGYDLHEDHFEEICTGFGCEIYTVGTDEVRDEVHHSREDLIETEYGRVRGYTWENDLHFMVEDIELYSEEFYMNYKMCAKGQRWVSFGGEMGTSVGDIHTATFWEMPISVSNNSYEEFLKEIKYDEIKRLGTREEVEGYIEYYTFRTKWGEGEYMLEDSFEGESMYRWSIRGDRGSAFTIQGGVDRSGVIVSYSFHVLDGQFGNEFKLSNN